MNEFNLSSKMQKKWKGWLVQNLCIVEELCVSFFFYVNGRGEYWNKLLRTKVAKKKNVLHLFLLSA